MSAVKLVFSLEEMTSHWGWQACSILVGWSQYCWVNDGIVFYKVEQHLVL